MTTSTSVIQSDAFKQTVQLLQQGRLVDAEQHISRLIAGHPDAFEPLHLGAVIAFQSDRKSQAIERLRSALSLQPDHAQGLSDLGMMLHSDGAWEAAEVALVKALELAPGLAAAHLNLGNVLADLGQKIKAERHYREALRLQPRLGAALNNLSKLLLTAGKPAEAEDMARQLIALAPQNGLGHSQRAAALDRLGRLDEAIEAHKKAVGLNPSDNVARLAYAKSLAGYGRMDAAIAECRTAVAARPDDVAALTELAGLVRLSEDAELMAEMKALAESDSVSPVSRATLLFALGKAAEQAQNYAEAFQSFQAGNALMRKTVRYSPVPFNSVADDALAHCNAELFERRSRVGHMDSTPIFIVGMPRSGTTLTEQIMCANTDVFGAGEPGILRALAVEVQRAGGLDTVSGMLEKSSDDVLRKLGADYVNLLRGYSATAGRIIDKVPNNFLFVGLIHLCLPNARIVHCQRAAADTCLSIFKTRFATGNQLFSYDLDELAAVYARYKSLMAHWDRELPGVVHIVKYEEMVADQEGRSRALFQHCGLEWTDAALSFHKTERPVHTASITQVRQPIYDASKGIAGRYGAAAKPLIEALERAGVDPFAV